MKKTIEERKEFAKIIAQAWVDDEFKKRLLDDPATVLKGNGIEIPEGMIVKVVEDTESVRHIVLPLKPAAELAAEDLDKIAGGLNVPHHITMPPRDSDSV